jgi:predicted GIY-YIG superfamily endonuclease
LTAIARRDGDQEWRREWKVNLIEQINAEWIDLYQSPVR